MSDTLILLQTIILFLTAAIVFWYTLETNKIRKETSKQNSILAEQLTLLQKAQDFEISKETSFLEPYFQSIQGGYRETIFVNKGSEAQNLSIKVEKPYRAKISPSYIGREQRGKIIIEGLPQKLPDSIHFTIEYKNKLGQKRTKAFFRKQDGHFEEADTKG